MKLEIYLFVLSAICLSASAEKLKGRRGQLLDRSEHENVDVKAKRNEKMVRSLKSDPSKGRFFHKKQGNTAPAQPPTIILVQSPTGGGSATQTGSPTYSYSVTSTGTSTGTVTTSEVPATAKATDNDEDDFADELDDEYDNQAPIGNKKQQKNNLKLKKVKGKKPSVKYVVPARYVHNFENSAPVSNSGNFKNGGNKFIRLRLDDNANVKKKSENIPIRLLVQKP